MIPRDRLLRVAALPAFEGLSAQAIFIRKYGALEGAKAVAKEIGESYFIFHQPEA